MIEFSTFIAKTWDISEKIATEICEHFEKGDSVFFVCDYVPSITAEIDISLLTQIYEQLQEIKELAPKKKRVLNALEKIGELSPEAKGRVRLCTSSVELDDMLLPLRSNTRSRAQLALAKGLGPLVDTILAQEIEEGTLQDLAKEYIGKDSSHTGTEEVIADVKDILVERFAYDETARSMVREYGFDDGFFEILPKVKKDKRFLQYRGKMVPIAEVTAEEFLNLNKAEEEKDIRFKHGVQLFHIHELLRHHFIENPDSVGYDLICEAIDECWSRLLQPVVERDVKARLMKSSEDWALRKIDEELRARFVSTQSSQSILAIGKVSARDLVIVAVGSDGSLQGATLEQFDLQDKQATSNRVKQFVNRYRPQKIIIKTNEFSDSAEEIVKRSLKSEAEDIPVEKCTSPENIQGLISSAWMQERCAVLDQNMKDLYAIGIAYLQPLVIIPEIGVQYFALHPMQKHVRAERLAKLINLRITEIELHKGVVYRDAPDSVLRFIDGVPLEVLVNIRKDAAKRSYNSKNDLLQVEGMTEVIFRNIAGYIIIPTAPSILDRTLVHPDHFGWLNELSQEINASIETLIQDTERLHSAVSDDFARKAYLDQKIPAQLSIAQRFPSLVQGGKHRKKQRLSELVEGAIVSGRVTNITKFGVFVDINAVCDGLIHISQLADEYVETAEQVVKPNDVVDVRILNVDKKKRRVSLSMKKLGARAPKVKPSQGQLSNLADHFKNR